MKKYNRILRYVDDIRDPEIKAIIKLRYLRRRKPSWSEVCSKLYGIYDSDYCRKKVERYFTSHSEDLNQLEQDLNEIDDQDKKTGADQ